MSNIENRLGNHIKKMAYTFRGLIFN